MRESDRVSEGLEQAIERIRKVGFKQRVRKGRTQKQVTDQAIDSVKEEASNERLNEIVRDEANLQENASMSVK